MSTIELLLGLAAILASLSGAMVAFVLWVQRPRYKRGRRSTWRTSHSSALPASSPRRPDEGSLGSVRTPRTRIGSASVPVADVEDDAQAGSAEVRSLITH